MTTIIKIGTVLICLVIGILVITPVSAGLQSFDNGKDGLSGLPTSLPIDIPDGIGTVGEDGNLHVNLATEPSTGGEPVAKTFSPGQIIGSYQDKTMKKTTGVDGSLFEGGADIDYTVAPDNSVTGKVAYKFIEQGWTIKIKGTVHGMVTPDGNMKLTSNDANVQYAGNNYPITMNVNARYNGEGFTGTKVINAAGVTGTLDFNGVRAE